MTLDPRTLSGRVLLFSLGVVVLLLLQLVVDTWGTQRAPGLNITVVKTAGFFLTVVLVGAGALSLLRTVCRPLQAVADALDQVSVGNLQVRVPVAGPLELQRVAVNLNAAVAAVQGTTEAFILQAQTLQQQAATLTSATRNLEDDARDALSRLTEVVRSARLISDLIADVSVALTELQTSFSDVAAHAESTRVVAVGSASSASDASRIVDDLARASGTIATVAATIADIAVQTKLLALNATIEAARATSGGKGFAVVADEVKLLASDTAAATARIDDLATQVGAGVSAALESIHGLESNVGEVLTMSDSVAGAVVEQRGVVAQAASAAAGVADRTVTMTGLLDHIAADASRALDQSEQLHAAADRLTRLGVHLELLASSLSPTDGPLNKERMQFLQAIARHVSLYSRLYAAFTAGELFASPQALEQTHDCFFGRWLAGLPTSEQVRAGEAGLVEAHERFHQRAAAATRTAESVGFAEALIAVDDVMAASDELIERANLWWQSRP